MKISNLLIKLTISIFFIAILLVRIKFGSYSFFHPILLLILLLIAIFPNKLGFNGFFKLDRISIYILIFLLFVLISYFLNIPNAALVSKTYSSNSGESPSNLYWKIMINGIIFVLSGFVAYLLGKAIGKSKEGFLKLYNFLIFLCLFNAFVNVIAWIITTGGVIDRYNFVPPITFSPGVSIQYSIIGFLLGLAALSSLNLRNQKRWLKICLAIFLLSILIILTRQSQISFLIMCIWYYFKTHEVKLKTILFFIPASIVLLVGGISIMYFSGALEAYGMIDSTESVDVAVRLLMLNSAYEIFIANPIVGVGYGMFVGHNNVPVVITGVPSYLASPHNGVASVLCELGSVGIILLIVITYIVIKELNRAMSKIKDRVIYRYCVAIYVLQMVFLLSVVISNSNLFGPPSELSYLYFSFISWFMIGSVIGVKNAKL